MFFPITTFCAIIQGMSYSLYDLVFLAKSNSLFTVTIYDLNNINAIS